MSDQAQGLRVLADQARRDHNSQSLILDASTADVMPLHAPDQGDGTGPGSLAPSPIPTQAVVPMPRMEDDQHAVVTSVAANLVAANSVAANSVVANSVVANVSYHGPFVSARPAIAKCTARVIAVTSGKGGVGKTNISTNLSLVMAAAGKRVIVVDADLGLANLHLVMGVTPKYHLEHVMGGRHSLKEALCPGPNGIQIIAGASGLAELADLPEVERHAFIEQLQQLDDLADVIMIDTGAGLSRNVMSFLCAVEEVIVVTTPEPTAITDAYATMKVVLQGNPEARLMLVVNMAQHAAEAEAVATRLQSITRRFLNHDVRYLGYVPHDLAVCRAVRTQQPFVLAYPNSQAAVAIRQIASTLVEQATIEPPQRGMSGFLVRMQRFFGVSRSSSRRRV